jgi:hypothetical protein
MNTGPSLAPKPFYHAQLQAMHPLSDRQHTMYLSTVNDSNSRALSPSKRCEDRLPYNLRTEDINAKKPTIMISNNFTLKTDDLNQKKVRKVRAASSTCPSSLISQETLIPKSNCRNFGKRHIPTNPLNPEYHGIHEADVKVEEARFIKNPLEVADIDGAQTQWRAKVKKHKLSEIINHPRPYTPITTCQLQKIVFQSEYQNDQGSNDLNERNHSKRKRASNCEGRFDNLDVKDISQPKASRLSSRCVNPMNPQYFYYDNNKHPAFLEQIKHSRSVRRPNDNKPSDMSLRTLDIDGARPNTNHYLVVKGHPRQEFTKTNDLSNFENIRPGSAHKWIKTKRCTNPLERDYPLTQMDQEGFLIGSEHRNSNQNSHTNHKGKKIIDAEARLRAKKNWDIINHKVKDPSLPENFRSEGKKINPDWVKPPNDIFLLDTNYTNSIQQTSNLSQSKHSTRNPISGEGLHQKTLRPVIITDEERLQNMDRLKLKNLKTQASVFQKENRITDSQKQRLFSGSRKPNALRKDFRAKDLEFVVSFKAMNTVHEKFDEFVNL